MGSRKGGRGRKVQSRKDVYKHTETTNLRLCFGLILKNNLMSRDEIMRIYDEMSVKDLMEG